MLKLFSFTRVFLTPTTPLRSGNFFTTLIFLSRRKFLQNIFSGVNKYWFNWLPTVNNSQFLIFIFILICFPSVDQHPVSGFDMMTLPSLFMCMNESPAIDLRGFPVIRKVCICEQLLKASEEMLVILLFDKLIVSA